MTQHSFVKKKRETVLHGGSLIILLLRDGFPYGFPYIFYVKTAKLQSRRYYVFFEFPEKKAVLISTCDTPAVLQVWAPMEYCVIFVYICLRMFGMPVIFVYIGSPKVARKLSKS